MALDSDLESVVGTMCGLSLFATRTWFGFAGWYKTV